MKMSNNSGPDKRSRKKQNPQPPNHDRQSSRQSNSDGCPISDRRSLAGRSGAVDSQTPPPCAASEIPRKRPNTKQTGERSEAAFLARAIKLGFGIAKPWGDSLRYDFILDNGERLIRIQVKCTESIRARAYETRATYTTGKGRAVYTKKDVDFIAAHVVPLDLWYILPVEICTPQPMLRFYPHRQAKKMRLEPYRENWRPLKPTSHKDNDGPITIYAVADEMYSNLFWLTP